MPAAEMAEHVAEALADGTCAVVPDMANARLLSMENNPGFLEGMLAVSVEVKALLGRNSDS